MPFNSLAVFHFLFCFFWFVVAIHRPLFFFFVTHSQFRTGSRTRRLALALSLSFVHLFARSTCLLSLPEMVLSHCNTLIYKDFFLFSASISIPNRIPMSKKDHMNRMNCHWMTHTNAKTVTYALANRIVWQFNF